MRSPTKSVSKRVRDAEAELNLPPGFRFHPTDEELVVDYLCRKAAAGHHNPSAAGVPSPPPIIAEVDLYKHDPWDLPEWYFFTPRDRKYPNGSRPNRAAGNGYWKATGADKPIRPKSTTNITVGIKKALVFYAGKGSKGIKTNWIMHEYRLVAKNLGSSSKHTSKLDEWVLCRLYNKKNNLDEKIILEDHCDHHGSPLEELQSNNSSGGMDSFGSFEGNSDDVEVGSTSAVEIELAHGNEHDISFGGNFQPQSLTRKVNGTSNQANSTVKMESFIQGDGNFEDDVYGNEWLTNMSLEDLQHSLEAMPSDPFEGMFQMPMIYPSIQKPSQF